MRVRKKYRACERERMRERETVREIEKEREKSLSGGLVKLGMILGESNLIAFAPRP